MKPSDFETNFTAWLDGKMAPDETAAFEQEMRAQGFDPAAEKSAHGAMRGLLREHSVAPALANAEFFAHHLQHQIEREKAPEAEPPRRGWWTMPRLAWAGAASLLV